MEEKPKTEPSKARKMPSLGFPRPLDLEDNFNKHMISCLPNLKRDIERSIMERKYEESKEQELICAQKLEIYYKTEIQNLLRDYSALNQINQMYEKQIQNLIIANSCLSTKVTEVMTQQTRKIQMLQTELSNLKNSQKSQSQQHKNFQKEVQMHKQKIYRLEQTIKQKQSTIKGLEQSNNNQQEDNQEQIKKLLEDLTSSALESEKLKRNLMNQKEQIFKKCDKIQKELKKERQQSISTIEQLNKKNKETQNKYNRVTKDKQQIQKIVQNQKNQLASKTTQIISLKNKINNLNNQIKGLDNKNSQLNQFNLDLKKDYQNKIERKQKQYKEICSQYQRNSAAQIQKLRTKLKQNNNKISQIELDRQNSENQLSKCRSKLRENQTNNKELQLQIKKYQNEIQAYIKIQSQYKISIKKISDDHKSQIERKQQNNKQLMLKLTENQKIIQLKDAENKKSQALNNQLKRKYDAKEEQYHRLKLEKDNQSCQLAKWIKYKQSLTQERDRLKEQIKQMYQDKDKQKSETEKKIYNIQQSYKRKLQQSKNECNNVNDRLNSLTIENKNTLLDIQSKVLMIKNLKIQAATSTAKIENYKKKIDQLNQSKNQADKIISQLNRDIESKRNENEDQKRSKKVFQQIYTQRQNDYKIQIKNLQETKSLLQKQLKDKKNQIEYNRAQLQQLKLQTNKQKQVWESGYKKNTNMIKDLEEEKKELLKRIQELSKYKISLDSEIKINQGKQQRIRQYERKVQQYDLQMKSLTTQIQEKKYIYSQKMGQMKNQLQQKCQQINKANIKNKELQNQIAAKMNQISKQKGKNQELIKIRTSYEYQKNQILSELNANKQKLEKQRNNLQNLQKINAELNYKLAQNQQYILSKDKQISKKTYQLNVVQQNIKEFHIKIQNYQKIQQKYRNQINDLKNKVKIKQKQLIDQYSNFKKNQDLLFNQKNNLQTEKQRIQIKLKNQQSQKKKVIQQKNKQLCQMKLSYQKHIQQYKKKIEQEKKNTGKTKKEYQEIISRCNIQINQFKSKTQSSTIEIIKYQNNIKQLEVELQFSKIREKAYQEKWELMYNLTCQSNQQLKYSIKNLESQMKTKLNNLKSNKNEEYNVTLRKQVHSTSNTINEHMKKSITVTTLDQCRARESLYKSSNRSSSEQSVLSNTSLGYYARPQQVTSIKAENNNKMDSMKKSNIVGENVQPRITKTILGKSVVSQTISIGSDKSNKK